MSPITLQYRGRLLASNDKVNKHELRKYFHPQLKSLWENPPSDLYHCSVSGADYPVRDFKFKPTLSKTCATCELNITLLTRTKPGGLIHDGDLDNRLKNIFDALRLPTEADLPSKEFPTNEDNPFYVLLEDDRSITDFRVRSTMLLLPKTLSEPLGYSELTIEVRPKTLNHI